jgi:hypothetical protein
MSLDFLPFTPNKMYNRILTSIALGIISACSSPENQINTALVIDLEKSNGDKLSELFASVSYTLLDAGDKTYLAMPGKLTVSKNVIFVRDSRLSNLLIFNEDGTLKTSINANLNPGPGEFLQSEDFQVLEDRIKIRDYPQNKTFV